MIAHKSIFMVFVWILVLLLIRLTNYHDNLLMGHMCTGRLQRVSTKMR
jgi:hypothetical protein